MSKERIFGKKELKFTSLRYIVFFIQGIRTSVVAYVLGPYFLGIYGFLMLYIQYLSYSNLGIQYSLNSEISILDANKVIEKEKIINSGFTGIFLNSILLILASIFIFTFKVNLFPLEDSYKYIFVIISITVFNHFQKLFVTIFRIEKKLTTIIVGEFVIGFSLLTIVLLFEGIYLINVLFYGWTILLLIVLIYFNISYNPIIRFDTSRIKLLLKSGFPQLVYLFSYFLMTLVTKTLIGKYYPVEVMGYITLAISVTAAIMLGLNTITWLIFPSMLRKLSDTNLKGDILTNYIVGFSNKLIMTIFIIISVCIFLLPIFFEILTEYKPVHLTLIILLINQIIFNAGFLLTSLCISRRMHLQIAVISILAVIFSSILSLIFIFLDFPFIWMIVSNFIGSLIFFNMLLYFVSNTFKLKISRLKSFFNWDIQLILILIILSVITEFNFLIFLFILLVLILKRKVVNSLYTDLSRLLKNDLKI